MNSFKRYALILSLLLGGAFANQTGFAAESTGQDGIELYNADDNRLTKLIKEKLVQVYENPELWEQATCSVALGSVFGGIDYFLGTGDNPIEGLVRFWLCGLSWETLPFSSVLSWLAWFSVSSLFYSPDAFLSGGPRMLAHAANCIHNVFWLSSIMRDSGNYFGKGNYFGMPPKVNPASLEKVDIVTGREVIWIFLRSMVGGGIAAYLDLTYGKILGVSSILLMRVLPVVFPLNGDERRDGAKLNEWMVLIPYVTSLLVSVERLQLPPEENPNVPLCLAATLRFAIIVFGYR